MTLRTALHVVTQPLRRRLHMVRQWFADEDEPDEWNGVGEIIRLTPPPLAIESFPEDDPATHSACGFASRCRDPFGQVKRLDVAMALDRVVATAETSRSYSPDQQRAVREAALFLQRALTLTTRGP